MRRFSGLGARSSNQLTFQRSIAFQVHHLEHCLWLDVQDPCKRKTKESLKSWNNQTHAKKISIVYVYEPLFQASDTYENEYVLIFVFGREETHNETSARRGENILSLRFVKKLLQPDLVGGCCTSLGLNTKKHVRGKHDTVKVAVSFQTIVKLQLK